MVQGVHKANYDKPYSTMVEYLDAMDAGIYFSPQPSTPPRRVLAALGPKMLKLAAERGEGAHPYFTPVEHTVFARETMGAGPLLAPELAVVLNEEPSVAKEIASKYMTTYTRLPNYANNLKRFGYSDAEITGHADRLMDAIVPRGSMDVIVGRIREHLDAGADHVCVQVLTATPGVLPMKQWQELADAVKGL
jgi:probable F420-dependent oxidoreductase